jgi:hypothetical protein
MALHRYFVLTLLIAVPALAMHGGRTHTGEPAASSLYESAFRDYRPFEDKPVMSWLSVNEAIAESVGGHAGSKTPMPVPVSGEPHPQEDMKEKGHEH